jgi:hypothetical protein
LNEGSHLRVLGVGLKRHHKVCFADFDSFADIMHQLHLSRLSELDHLHHAFRIR